MAERTGLRDLGDEPNPRQQVRRSSLVPAVHRPSRSPAAIPRPPALGSAGSAHGSGPSAVRAVSQVRVVLFGIWRRVVKCWIKRCCLHVWIRCTYSKPSKFLIDMANFCLNPFECFVHIWCCFKGPIWNVSSSLGGWSKRRCVLCRYQVQDSDSALSKGCDAECRRNTLCAIVEGDKFMPRKCRPHDWSHRHMSHLDIFFFCYTFTYWCCRVSLFFTYIINAQSFHLLNPWNECVLSSSTLAELRTDVNEWSQIPNAFAVSLIIQSSKVSFFSQNASLVRSKVEWRNSLCILSKGWWREIYVFGPSLLLILGICLLG